MSERPSNPRLVHAGDDRLPTEYRYRYEMAERFGRWRHRYILVAADGAVEFWVTEHDADTEAKYGPSCGLEVHYRQPPEYMERRAPSHDRCETLGGAPCWHDGTSLYASETLYPLWHGCSGKPKEMLRMLVHELESRFGYDYAREETPR